MPVEMPPPERLDHLADQVGEAVGQRFGERFTMSAPYPVEMIDLASLLDDGQLRASAPLGDRWQCIVGPTDPRTDDVGGAAMAAVDLAAESDGGYSVISINVGTMAQAVNRAARIAADYAQDRTFSFSTVELPELNFVAVRMVEIDDDPEEVFIPLVAADVAPEFSEARDSEAFELAPVSTDQLVDVLQRWIASNRPDEPGPSAATSGTDDGPDRVGSGSASAPLPPAWLRALAVWARRLLASGRARSSSPDERDEGGSTTVTR